MSESTERLGGAVVDGVLAAVADPALVCDRTGALAAWNDPFAERAPGHVTLDDATVGGLVDWPDGDPVAGALDGEETTAPGRLAGDGRRYSVTARPLTGGGDVVGAVAAFDDEPAGEWSPAEAIVEHSPDTIHVFDDDHRIRLTSDAFERVTKIPTEELSGEHAERLADYGVLDEAEMERARAALDAVLDGEATERTVVTHPRVGDETLTTENHLAPVRHDGEIVGAVDVVRDVTERARVEEALRTSRERLQTLLDTLPVGLFVVDADGEIDHVQGFDVADMGFDREDLVGLPVEVFAGRYDPLVEGSRRALDGEPTSRTATVGDRTFEAFFEPVRDDGEVTGTIAVAIDVTDREKRERELARTNERLDLALANTDAGVYEWHVDDDRVVWHESTVRQFGVDRDAADTLGEAVEAFVAPADRGRVRGAVEDAVAEDGTLSVEFRTNDPETDTEWVIAEGEVNYDADGDPERLVGTLRDVTERKQRERELAEREQRLRAVIESSADPIAMQDTDGRYRVVNEAMAEIGGCSRECLRGATAAEIFDDGTAARIERHREEVLSTEGARVAEEAITVDDGDGERVLQLTVAPHYGPDREVRGTVTIARDITELERQQGELETLTEIQGLIHESIRALTTATTREEIKETVCERLAESAFYEAAWIGTRDSANRRIEPDYATGEAAAYLDEVTVSTRLDDEGCGPAGTAYRTGEVQVVDDAADPAFERWTERASEHGFEGVVAVPLSQGATTHGVLVVYSGRPDAFSERDATGFEVLGEAVGFALSAAQNRRLLESDRVLELEFEILDGLGPFEDVTREQGCRLVFDSAVHTSDGHVINYLTVEGGDVDRTDEVLDEHVDLVAKRRLGGEDGPHFELKWRESVHKHLQRVGARGTHVAVEDGVGTMFVEAPNDADIRQVTEAVTAHFGDVALAAKREREQSDVGWWRPHGDISARLTDRQRSVLQAAYYSGYYEWPRETDAETLADSLDIASTTLLQHLRKGHRRILEAAFES